MDEGHSEDVYAIQMVGCILVSGSMDKTVRIWDLLAQRLVAPPLLGHNGGVLSLQFDPNPGRDIIFSGDTNGQMICWKFSTRTMIGRLTDAHADAVITMKMDGDRLTTGSADGMIKLWQLGHDPRDALQPTQIEHKRSFIGHAGGINAVDISGDLLVSASSDRTVRIWSVSTDMIISGGGDGTLRLYNRHLQGVEKRLRGHRAMVRALEAHAYEDHTDVIVSGSYDGSVIVWTREEAGKWLLHHLNASAFPGRAARGVAHTARTASTGNVEAILRSRPRSIRTSTRLRSEDSLHADQPAMVFRVDMNERWLVCAWEGSSSICGWDYTDREQMMAAVTE
ncbi:hypothetical protein LTS14_010416 [Recurvomyces mirabilis]|uniref:uncharacterized protein n=1 Tax=Recurvomyces mirabilis TaxID=574656 RepID=UPI002DE118D3|nr:hypothetical protein LTS14_010416 [Recurvomyces mirabilis]